MNIIEAISVSKNFGSVTALKDFSCVVREGDILGLIGPNGAGKTTLVNLITGSLTYSGGDIRFLGKSIRGLKAHQIGKLGISRTSPIGPPASRMTALENVMVGALFGKTGRQKTWKAGRNKAAETLDFMGLAVKKHVPVENLTVLECKRLEIAVALAMNPTLLILDEVNAGLNPHEIVEAVAFIKKIRDAGVTVLVIEHVMRVIAKVSDHIVVLHHGEKIIEGSPDTVLKDPLVIETYLGKRYNHKLPDRVE
jgi:branched-chain amino acid transport system ATP-binding protein